MKIVTILNIFVKVLFTSCICVDYLLIFCVNNFMCIHISANRTKIGNCVTLIQLKKISRTKLEYKVHDV